MPRIRANCPHCGEIELRPDEIELHVVGADTDDVRNGSSYLFDCPECAAEVVKPADSRIARLLTVGGVPTTFTERTSAMAAHPAGRGLAPPHPEVHAGGPPLTSDDLLDFHQLLERDDWFERLRQTC